MTERTTTANPPAAPADAPAPPAGVHPVTVEAAEGWLEVAHDDGKAEALRVALGG